MIAASLATRIYNTFALPSIEQLLNEVEKDVKVEEVEGRGRGGY